MRALDAHVPAALLRILDRATTGALKGSAGRPARLASLRCLAQMAHHELGRAQILEPLPGQRPSPESSRECGEFAQ